MQGEPTFELLVETHHRAVSAYARALCSDRTVAEDAVQETFLRAWRYLDTYRASGSFEGWLLSICRRCVIDLAQLETRLAAIPQPMMSAAQPDHSSDLFDLLAELPLPQREVLVLCALFGYEYEDAALILDVPVGTVRSRLHRARAAIATLLVDSEPRSEAG